jgi:hypothetical protein
MCELPTKPTQKNGAKLGLNFRPWTECCSQRKQVDKKIADRFEKKTK